MQIDDFLTLVKKRRSIRRWKPDPISDETINKILEAARWSMSGANGQPWELVVIRNQDTKNKLAEIFKEGRKMVNELELMRADEYRHYHGAAPPEKQLDFKDAPVIIAVCGDMRCIQASVMASSFMGEGHVYYMNMANVCQNIHLATAASGLGAEWISIARQGEHKLREVVGVPDPLTLMMLVPIGVPAYTPTANYRRELSEFVHYEKYDMSKYRSNTQVREFIGLLRGKTAPAYTAGHQWKPK